METYNVELQTSELERRLKEIKEILKAPLNREWQDESLYTVAQIAANAISWRDRELESMKNEVEKLKQEKKILQQDMPVDSSKWGYAATEKPLAGSYPLFSNPSLFGGLFTNAKPDDLPSGKSPRGFSYWVGYEDGRNTVKPLTISEAVNFPCTAALEVRLQKLAAYFEKRAKENRRREEKEEKVAKQYWRGIYDPMRITVEEYEQHNQSGYYFSGKADAYDRAAKKLQEALGVTSGPDITKRWIVEFRDPVERWLRSMDMDAVFPSKKAAYEAIASRKLHHPNSTLVYRARLLHDGEQG